MNRIIPFSLAQPGMVLAEAAAADGQVLLAAGTELNAAQIAMLTKRGVRSLSIVQAQQRARLGAQQVLELDRVLRPRFARCGLAHPALKELYRLALLRQVRRALQAEGGHAR